MQAAMEVFAERGYHGASIEAISERAGFTRGAFYRSFASKEELFLALFDQQNQRRMDALRGLLDEEVAPEELLSELTRRVTATGAQDRQWFLLSTEFTLHAIRDPAVSAALAERDRQVRRTLADIVTDICRRLGRDPHIDTERLAAALVALHEGLRNQFYVDAEGAPLPDVFNEIVPLLLNAATTERAW